MASPSELSLDCKPHGYSMLLKPDQTQKLEEQLARLEEERLKIDAFKRELPLCMQLLSNAVENSRQQLDAYKVNNQGTRAVLEEFIPINHYNSEGSEKSSNVSDKASWMTSAQLWSQASDSTKQQSSITSPIERDHIGGFRVSPRLGFENKQRNGGAFLPFSKDQNSLRPSTPSCPLPELVLASNDKEMEDKECSENENGLSCSIRENSNKIEQGKGGYCNGLEGQNITNSNTNCTSSQTHRKARRCWSPDLHRRFIYALQMLGGSQAATPKQIRELMKVDGLTNDEVKSHLQKYRLHTRRPSPNPQAAGAPGPQLVVLGGIWVPPDYATAAVGHTPGPTLYTGPPQYCASPMPQEFYPVGAAPSGQQFHHHTIHQQLQLYKAASQTHVSPESDLGGDGDRSESIEDGKSESNSWKGESGERKGVGAVREDGEESNVSGISLKF